MLHALRSGSIKDICRISDGGRIEREKAGRLATAGLSEFSDRRGKVGF
jgi:hypothetical protein